MKNKLIDLKKIIESANLYQQNLVDKNLLVIYEDRITKKYSHIEFVFYDTNFLHLTGVIFNLSTRDNKKSSYFFKKCLNNELSLNDFSYHSDGTSKLKIDILTDIVQIHKRATMIGDYNYSRPALFTEKIYGSVRSCLGTIATDTEFYVPNTALKEDIRLVVSKWQPIKAIYIKNISDEFYQDLTKKANNYDYNALNKEIKIKIKLI